MAGDESQTDDFMLWWNARVAALEQVLGKSHSIHGHALIPFDAGPELGGAADIIYFHDHVDGVVSATSELIGRDDQITGALGNFELIICHRDENEDWGPDLISQLAHYTCETELGPGDTMDIGEAAPDGSSIAGLLFLEYARFKVRDRDAGLLLCMGITSEELAHYRAGHRGQVIATLAARQVYPFTDLYRQSVV